MVLSATALKNRDSGHTNTPRVLWEGTDKRDKNYRRYRRALKWGIMKQAETVQSGKRWLTKCMAELCTFANTMKRQEGEKTFSPSLLKVGASNEANRRQCKTRRFFTGAHFSCESLHRMMEVPAVYNGRTTNTSLNEKNLSRIVQEIAPLSWSSLSCTSLMAGGTQTSLGHRAPVPSTSHPDSEPPPDSAPAQQGPSAAAAMKVLSPASSPVPCALKDPSSMMFCCYLNPASLSSSLYLWIIDTIL